MKKEAIVFDIDDTLITTTPSHRLCRKSAIQNLCRALPALSLNEATSAEVRLYRRFSWSKLPDLWRAVALQCSGELPEDLVISKVYDSYQADFISSIEAVPSAAATLEKLLESNIHLAIISDGDEEFQLRKLAQVDLLKYFNTADVLVAQQTEIYKNKPSTGNFRLLGKRWGLKPQQIAYVGDKPVDVLAANTTGWTSVQTVEVVDHSQCRTEALAVEQADTIINELSQVLEMVKI
jgi:FMN phosphatase YigB (HAD superfamily)